MNNLLTFSEFLNENYIQLNEAFQSNTLALFVTQFSEKNYYTKLPDGILWNEIPDDEVIAGTSLDPVFKKQVKNNDYVVFWFNDEKQLLRYKSPTYSRWGGFKQDKSQYLPGKRMFITKGDKFLTNARNFTDAVPATVKYDKPAGGDLGSVKTVYDELKLSAIAIKYSILLKYSSVEIMKVRKEQKKNALALQPLQNILLQNMKRYREYATNAKTEKGTRELTIKTEAKLKTITDEINKTSANGLGLFDTMIDPSKKDDKFGSFTINTDNIKKLEKLANDYNKISCAYIDYIEYYRKVANGSDFYKDTLSSYTTRLTELIA